MNIGTKKFYNVVLFYSDTGPVGGGGGGGGGVSWVTYPGPQGIIGGPAGQSQGGPTPLARVFRAYGALK